MTDTKQKKKRSIIKTSLTVFVVLFLAVVVLLNTLNLNNYKEQIETKVSEAIGDSAKIGGDIEAGFSGIWPSIILHDVMVGSKKTTEYTAETLEVSLPFGHLGSEGGPFAVYINIRNLGINGKKFGDYDAPVKFGKSGFEVSDLSGELDGADISGNLLYQDNKLKADLKVEDLPYAAMAEGIEGGKIQIAMNIEGSGDTGDKIINSLSGHAVLSGDEAKMAGNAINFWAGDLMASILSGPQAESKINCTIADFKILNGIAKSNMVVLDTDRVTVYGKGQINLAKSYVDMLFTPKPKDSALVSLATPVKVHGNFDNIKAGPEELGMLKKIGGIVLTTINPAAALLPLLETGTGDDNPCVQYVKAPAE